MKKREGTRKQEIKGWSEKREDGSRQVSGKTKWWNEGISFDSISLSYLSNGMIIHTLPLHLLPSFLPSSSLLHSSEPNQRFLTFSWIGKGKKKRMRMREKRKRKRRREGNQLKPRRRTIKLRICPRIKQKKEEDFPLLFLSLPFTFPTFGISS